MADIIVRKKQYQRVRGRPFRKGQSGNPAGRPPGARNRGAQFAETLLGEQAEALTRKAVELALGGDPGALRLCLERIVAPRRERTVRLPLPVMRDAAGLADAMAVVSASSELGRLVDTFRKAIETADFERRLQQVEEANAARPGRSNYY